MTIFNNKNLLHRTLPFYKQNGQKGVAHIAILLLLLAGLGVGVYLASQTQVFKPKADDPNANLSQGLVGYWKFDESSGSAVVDSSGNNNNGTWRGTLGNQWSAGKIGNAGNFNGTNNTVAINNNASLSPAGSFTIASWVKRGNTTAYSYAILAKGNLSSATTNAGYGLFLTAANQYSLRLSGNSVNPANVVSSKTYPDTNWHHVVGVYEPGVTSQTASQSGKMSIYVDGALAGTQTKNVPSSVSTNVLPVTIGATSTGLTANTWYWNGLLQEVRLYNRPLSAAEVYQLYNYNPTAGGVSNPVNPSPITTPTPSINPSPFASPSASTIGQCTRMDVIGGAGSSGNTYWVEGGRSITLMPVITPGTNPVVAWSRPSEGTFNYIQGGSFNATWTAPTNNIEYTGTIKASFNSRDPYTGASITSECPVITVKVPVNPVFPSPSPSPAAAKRVFVTNAIYDGNLGGLTGADTKCQASANTANLGGTWKAWLSDSQTSASSRFNHSDVPYKLINGVTIANNWQDLIDGNLQHTIDINEYGVTKLSTTDPSVVTWVWTGTNSLGNKMWSDSRNTCNDYTTNAYNQSFATPTPYSFNRAGRIGAADSWTDYPIQGACNTKMRIFCFEQ